MEHPINSGKTQTVIPFFTELQSEQNPDQRPLRVFLNLIVLPITT